MSCRLIAVITLTLAALAPVAAAQGATLSATNSILSPVNAPSVVSSSGAASIIGDVNGDGLADLAEPRSDSAFVLLGKQGLGNVDIKTLADVKGRGFTVTSAPEVVTAGFFKVVHTLTGAGDFDGDGINDLIAVSDRPYVVYGTRTPTNVVLTPGPGVTAIDTTTTIDDEHATAIGDFDGDGYDDIAVSRNNGNGSTIVHGGPRTTVIGATATSARTTLIAAIYSCQFNWYAFKYVCNYGKSMPSATGDFNGDGKDDILTGTTILYGRTGTATINLASLGSNFTRLKFPASLSLTSGVSGFGDVNGDGKADLLISRLAPPTYNDNFAILLGRSTPAADLDITEPAIAVRVGGFPTRTLRSLVPAGDQNGDGTLDAVATDGTTTRLITDLPRTAGSVYDFDSAPVIAGLSTLAGRGNPSVLGEAGDVDGDGLLDLSAYETRLAPLTDRPKVVLLTHGPDQLAPELVPITNQPQQESVLTPASFVPGTAPAGTQLSIALTEAATLDLTYRNAAGATVGTESRALPLGRTTTAWNGSFGGTPLAAGSYTLTLQPRDGAGNRGAAQVLPFTVQPTGTPTGPRPATLKITGRIVDPAHLIANNGIEVVGSCGPDFGFINKFVNGETQTAADPDHPGQQAVEGDACTGETLNYPLTGGGTNTFACASTYDEVKFNGGPTWPTVQAFRLAAGTNTLDVTRTCVPPAGGVGTFAAGGWKQYGSATISYGTGLATLTPAAANKTGSVVWPGVLNPNGQTFEFTANIPGGNGAGEGLTIAFLTAAGGAPVNGFLGTGGNLLGFGGLAGVAFSLDGHQDAGDPSANFVGVSTGTVGASMNYVQTGTPPVRLRRGAMKIKLVSKASVVSFWMNDKLVLTRAMTLPSSAFLAFTGATSTGYFSNQVSALTVSTS